MLAYGVPLRSVLRLAVVESLIMGLLATAIGVALGLVILGWVVNVNLKEVLPELGTITSLSFDPFSWPRSRGSAQWRLLRSHGTRLRRIDVPSHPARGGVKQFRRQFEQDDLNCWTPCAAFPRRPKSVTTLTLAREGLAVARGHSGARFVFLRGTPGPVPDYPAAVT